MRHLLLACAVLLAAISPGAAQFSDTESARAFFACKTTMTYSPRGPRGHGTQVEYLDPDGSAHLWYPGNRGILRGDWRISTVRAKRGGTEVGLCFRYDTFGRNPVTGTIGTQWICTSAAEQARRWTESRSGDVLQLKGRGPSIPFVLSPDRTSLSALAARMGISLKATGCAARTS